jgi:hypothetical protein
MIFKKKKEFILYFIDFLLFTSTSTKHISLNPSGYASRIRCGAIFCDKSSVINGSE